MLRKIIGLSVFIILHTLTICQSQVNYDESKIEPYILPEIFSSNIKPKKAAKLWQKHLRNEVLDLFKKQMFGELPTKNLSVKFTTTTSDFEELDVPVQMKIVSVEISNKQESHSFDIVVFLPIGNNDSFPLFLGMNFYGNHTIHESKSIPISSSWVRNNKDFGITNNSGTEASRGVRKDRWPLNRIITNGFGLATIYYGDVDPDFDDGFENGIHKLVNQEDKSAFSSIDAWAYTLSLAMDYFESDPDINTNQVAVIGHSRLGKTALWAGAKDSRFALVISNNSGCGGAALSQRKIGETVKVINTNFPHWFSPNFKVFNNKEDEIPFDQHMLISLIAPRPIYIASAKGDRWADPKGEYLSLSHASKVYEIFGNEALKENEFPVVDSPLWKGKLGYHIRTGKHNITDYDWAQYIEFAKIQFAVD
jgi:hypothetical protein